MSTPGSVTPARHTVTVAHGDGIGPEIMQAVLRILAAAGVPIDLEPIEVGEAVYRRGVLSGIPDEAWESIRRTRVLLKAPISTPQGGGYKSLNVTLRTTLGLFANVRECRSYTPYVASPHPGMNIVIIRENEEDLYAGIEYRQTAEVFQSLKILSEPGSEAIIRYAFEYARAYGRRRVTCMSKDNIMKLSDGMFHRVFDRVRAEYADVESDHQIIDIGAARVAAQPERLDVVVTLNLYGDIISDIAAQVAGSVGLAGSANVGRDAAMFEAIHGSAPDIAGKGVANPSGLLIAATQMLVHLGLNDDAERILNAWLCTLEDGIHTADIHREGLSREIVGTEHFTDAVIRRLGRTPRTFPAARFGAGGIRMENLYGPVRSSQKALVGADVFLDWSPPDRDPVALAERLTALAGHFRVHLISNRGVKVWPGKTPETFRTDHWRCRFLSPGGPTTVADVLALLTAIDAAGLDVIKVEHLYMFDGVPGYSLGQGE